MPYLVDTGVLLRMWDRSDPDHPKVIAAIRCLIHRRERLVTTAQNIAEFWNVCTRPQQARGGYGRTVEETLRRVLFLEKFGTILSDNVSTYDAWKQLVATHHVTGKAVHDARIVAQMLAWNIPNILTLNPGDFRRYSEIAVVTPAAVLSSTPPT